MPAANPSGVLETGVSHSSPPLLGHSRESPPAGALSLHGTADRSVPRDGMDSATWCGPQVLMGLGKGFAPSNFGDICGLRTEGLQESEPDTHTQAGVSPVATLHPAWPGTGD